MPKRLLIDIEEGMLRYGGAVMVDNVHHKSKGKHLYDFNVPFMEIKYKGSFEILRFNIRTMTLFLVEVPDHPNAANIRRKIYDALLDKYETRLYTFICVDSLGGLDGEFVPQEGKGEGSVVYDYCVEIKWTIYRFTISFTDEY